MCEFSHMSTLTETVWCMSTLTKILMYMLISTSTCPCYFSTFANLLVGDCQHLPTADIHSNIYIVLTFKYLYSYKTTLY